jgi:hypothetical protein
LIQKVEAIPLFERNRQTGDDRSVMVAPAVPLIVISLSIVLSAVVYIGGCAALKNWYPMLTLIPACLAGLAAIIFSKAGENESSRIQPESWLFAVAFFLVSTLMLPFVLWHCDLMSKKCLGLSYGGVGVFLVFFAVYVFISKPKSGDFNRW